MNRPFVAAPPAGPPTCGLAGGFGTTQVAPSTPLNGGATETGWAGPELLHPAAQIAATQPAKIVPPGLFMVGRR
ncbi:MAG TPA: hypothetical protein VHX15_12705 [Frankiaceae bacterium]|nr:hypothetical protein [Frankiaceae bacterium]